MTPARTMTAAPGTPTRLARRPQLSEEVAGRVRAWIMSGEIRPGEFVRLDETAAQLGVSVTPVREALVALRGEGMVDSVPHRGYVVSALSRDDIRDIFWLQGQIAVELALRAGDAIDEDGIAELEALAAELRAAVDAAAVDRIIDAEHGFHRALNMVAGGRKLAWFLQAALRYTPHHLYAADPSWGELAVRSHERLIAALRAEDRDQVAEQTRLQFTDGAQRLIDHLEQTGMWDD